MDVPAHSLFLFPQPIHLQGFVTDNTLSVFASSDRPTVVYSKDQKLMFSNVNLKAVSRICSFNNVLFPDSIVLAEDSTVTIGTIDEIQKLHIRSIPLGETAARITYVEQNDAFVILTYRDQVVFNQDGGEYEDQVHSVRLLHDKTFDILSSFQLEETEQGYVYWLGIVMAFGDG